MILGIGDAVEDGPHPGQMAVDGLALGRRQGQRRAALGHRLPEPRAARVGRTLEPVGAVAEIPHIPSKAHEAFHLDGVQEQDKAQPVSGDAVAVEVEVFQKRRFKRCAAGFPRQIRHQAQGARAMLGERRIEAAQAVLGAVARVQSLSRIACFEQALAQHLEQAQLVALVLVDGDQEQRLAVSDRPPEQIGDLGGDHNSLGVVRRAIRFARGLGQRLCLVLDDGLLRGINPGCCRCQLCAHRPFSNERVAEAPLRIVGSMPFCNVYYLVGGREVIGRPAATPPDALTSSTAIAVAL